MRQKMDYKNVLVSIPKEINDALNRLPEEYNKSGLLRNWIIDGFYSDKRMQNFKNGLETGRA